MDEKVCNLVAEEIEGLPGKGHSAADESLLRRGGRPGLVTGEGS